MISTPPRSAASSALRRRLAAVLLAGATLLAACTGVNEINVGAPQPAVVDTTSAALNRGSLLVELTAVGEGYAEGVQSTRFRVGQIWLKDRDGQWIKRLAESEPFRVGASGSITRRVLASQVPAAGYDSLALFLRDIYVEYGPTAGGVPTVRGAEPLTIAAAFAVENDERTILRLRYRPGASITRDTTDGRWTFAPVIAVDETTAPGNAGLR